MGEFHAMHKYFAIFLALVACHGSLFAHGRHIKPLNQHSKPNTNTAEVNVPTPSANHLQLDTPIMPKTYFADVDSGDSGAHYATNAFRPTTPGNSPGVGHRKFEGMKVMGELAHSTPDVKVSEAKGLKNNFRPRNPNHSPGVGHTHEYKIIGQPN